jgi:flagellar assembly protein FliH
MGLIKSQNSPVTVAFKWRDIEAEASQLVEDARRKSEAIIAEAQAAAAALRESARDDGYRRGHEQGVAEGQTAGQRQAIDEQLQQLDAAMGALRGAVEEVLGAKQQLHADAVGEMVELAIAIARRVTKRQATFEPQVLVANLREALALVGRGRQLRIAIHPTQHDLLRQALPSLEVEWPALGEAQFVADATLSPGGCRVFTEHGQIDADLQSQLDRVVEGLMPPAAQEEAA